MHDARSTLRTQPEFDNGPYSGKSSTKAPLVRIYVFAVDSFGDDADETDILRISEWLFSFSFLDV